MTDILTRGARLPSTLDRANRTVEATALSGRAPTVRPGPAPDGSPGPWVEELDAAGADLSALTGSPVLLDHKATVDSAVGTVASATRSGDQIAVSLRFDPSPAADTVMGKIEAGSVRGVSLGYRVQQWTRGGTRNGKPVFIAAAWTPAELSLTPLPLDPGATVRSAMTTTTTTDTTTPAIVVDPAPITTNRADVNRSIRSIATTASLPATWADDLIDRGADADEARRLAFEELGKRSRPVDNRAPAGTITVGTDYTDPAVMRRSMADALAHRLAPMHVKIEGTPAERYRSYGAIGTMAALLTIRGERFDHFNRDEIVKRSHSTSDFPELLADAANKSLLAQYQAAAPTYRQIAAPKPFNDFKPAKFLRLGDFPTFKPLAEAGEAIFGTISENRESVTAKSFVTGISITRETLINDDLSALGDFSSLIAIRAAQHENSLVHGLLANNGPTLSDGKALFHADHGNKAGSGTTIAAGIDAAVLAMRTQTGLDGAKLAIQPVFLVCGPAKEAEARRALAAINPTTTSDVNVWANAFTLVVDPEITGNRWFLAASPAQVPTLVYGYVRGATGPQIDTETDFMTKGVRVRAGLEFAAGVIDFRGIYSNAGA